MCLDDFTQGVLSVCKAIELQDFKSFGGKKLFISLDLHRVNSAYDLTITVRGYILQTTT